MPRPVPAVDEERVVGLRRRLGDGERGRVREAVRRADDEQVEGVLRVQARERLARPAAPFCGDDGGAARAIRRRGTVLRRPEPLASLTAARTRLPKCVSIHSRVKLLGTATTSSPFEIASPGAPHRTTFGRPIRSARSSSRPATSVQERICTSCSELAPPFRPRLLSPWKAAEHNSVHRRPTTVPDSLPPGSVFTDLQGVSTRPHSSPQVWKAVDSRRWQHRTARFRERTFLRVSRLSGCGQPPGDSARLYSRNGRSERLFLR